MAARQRDPGREQFWRETIAAWQAGGLSARAYCRRHRLSEASLHSWRRELRRRDEETPRRPAAPTFVPVTVIGPPPLQVEVRCPSGHTVSVANADASTLAQLLAALATVPPC